MRRASGALPFFDEIGALAAVVAYAKRELKSLRRLLFRNRPLSAGIHAIDLPGRCAILP